MARPRARLLDVRPGEGRALLLAGSGFLLVLFVNGVLRSVRDGLPDVRDMPWLFAGTFVGTLATTPLYLWVVSRFPRRRIVAIAYVGIAASLLGFAAALPHIADWAHPTPAEAAALRPFAAAFWLWFSTVNLLFVALFWSLMADVFGHERGRRLFAVIATGGTLGSLGGALFATRAATLGAPLLLLLTAGLLLASCFPLGGLLRLTAEWPARPGDDRRAPIGGPLFDGARSLVRRPFLRGVAAQVLCLTAIATFAYMLKAHVVRETSASALERVAGFARIDAVGCAFELLLQLLLTGPLLMRGNLLWGLRSLPIVGLLSCLLLSINPTSAMLGLLEGVRSGVQYAVFRPARELLFTVVPPLEIYGAKGCIDTLVYRGGDLLTAWISNGVYALAGTSGLALAGVPVALAWYGLAGWLARAHERQAAANSVILAGEPA